MSKKAETQQAPPEPQFRPIPYSEALEATKAGIPVRRRCWRAGLVMFRQIPSMVNADVVPRMTSLPVSVKQLVVSRNTPLRYRDQLVLLFPDNTIVGYSPSSSDVLGEDWEVLDLPAEPFQDGPRVARDTVGTAVPTE